MAKKKITKQFKIMAPGGQATPAPPIGPALGANGINPGQFIQQFNERTKELRGKTVGVLITVFADRSFEFEIKSSPASTLIKAAAGIPIEKKKGSEVINEEEKTKMSGKYAGFKITMAQARQIGQEKIKDLNATDVEAAARIIAGSARSMGIAVVEG